MFEKIKMFYDKGLYRSYHIRQFVLKDKLTEEEYELITCEAY